MDHTSGRDGSDRPYLSVVATARNDDHGGNLLRRMQIFVNGLIAQAKRHHVPTELVLVEWNPPPDKPPLAEALQWPERLSPASVRIVTVNAEIHRRFRFAESLPLYQMIAKNVGIRRAQGEFVLATNIDILFSDELFAFFAERRLSPDRMYRIDRHDAMSHVPLEASIEEQLEYCRTHLLRINAREGSYPVTNEGTRLLEKDDVAPAGSGITLGFGFGERRQEGGLPFRNLEPRACLLVKPPETPAGLWLHISLGPAADALPVELRVKVNGSELGRAAVNGPGWLRIPLSVEKKQTAEIVLDASPSKDPEDPRSPLYRLLRCDWEGPAENGSAALRDRESAPRLLFGAGWHDQEVSGGETFRWASSRADWVAGPSANPEWSLLAELEPGPAVGFGAVHMRVQDENGNVVSTAVIDRRRIVRFSLRVQPDRPSRYQLRTVYGEAPVRTPGDGRDLHLRMFGFEWAPQRESPGSAESTESRRLRLHEAPDGFFELTTCPEHERSHQLSSYAPPPHINGCGDFTLLARQHWFDLRGYPEFDLFSMHLDSVLCLAAHYGGLREEFLEAPKQIFHVEHAIGSGFTPEGNRKLFERLAAKGIEWLDWGEVFEWERQMKRLGAPMIFNRQHWGMADLALPETRIADRGSTVSHREPDVSEQ